MIVRCCCHGGVSSGGRVARGGAGGSRQRAEEAAIEAAWRWFVDAKFDVPAAAVLGRGRGGYPDVSAEEGRVGFKKRVKGRGQSTAILFCSCGGGKNDLFCGGATLLQGMIDRRPGHVERLGDLGDRAASFLELPDLVDLDLALAALVDTGSFCLGDALELAFFAQVGFEFGKHAEYVEKTLPHRIRS